MALDRLQNASLGWRGTIVPDPAALRLLNRGTVGFCAPRYCQNVRGCSSVYSRSGPAGAPALASLYHRVLASHGYRGAPSALARRAPFSRQRSSRAGACSGPPAGLVCSEAVLLWTDRRPSDRPDQPFGPEQEWPPFTVRVPEWPAPARVMHVTMACMLDGVTVRG